MHPCLHTTNKHLRVGNQRIQTHRAEDGTDGGPVDVPIIATESTDGVDGPKTVIAKFCPFCGQRLRGDRAGGTDE